MDRCLVATITRAHGIAGDLRVESHSDHPGRFALLRRVYVGDDPATAAAMTVVRAAESPSRVVLHLEGVDDRAAADALAGKRVYIAAEDMLPPPAGRHYVHDIVGCEAVDASGRRLGIVADVLRSGAQDLYAIDADGREVLIPAVPELILAVDTAARRVTVNAIPGLFDAAD